MPFLCVELNGWLQQFKLLGLVNCVLPAVDVQFAVDVFDVGASRVDGNDKLVGNFRA